MIKGFPHVGFFVADLDRATRFYVAGLGFAAQEGGRTDAPGPLLEMPGATVRTRFIRHPDGMRVELWTIEDRSSVDDVVDPRPADRPGRPHMCFLVDDLDAVAEQIVRYGGVRLDGTRSDLGHGELMFCADPDGTRIELVKVTQGWTGYGDT